LNGLKHFPLHLILPKGIYYRLYFNYRNVGLFIPVSWGISELDVGLTATQMLSEEKLQVHTVCTSTDMKHF